MKTIPTTLSVTNETDLRGQAILDLIAQYIPGFVGRYYGFRSIGTTDQLAFPCVFVEPSMQTPGMATTGKYFIRWEYAIYWYIVDNNQQDIVTLATSAAESLVKLFSNNALGNLNNQFKSYSPYWITSEMKSVEISRTFVNAVPSNVGRYMRAGVMRFEIQDQFTK